MDHSLKTPLLVVIDDHYKSAAAADLISHAHKVGVHVRTFESTLAAEAWLNHNAGRRIKLIFADKLIDFLRNHNTGAPGNVRVITDMVRLEDQGDGEGVKAHRNAGHKITQYIRSRFSNIPILVFTSHDNIVNTKWVKDIWLSGSTSHHQVAQDYVDQLGGVSKHNCN